MKQTKEHKFNLIETSDTFSPDPLNQNMETLETALAALTSRNDSGDSKTAALDKRITTLEGHRFATGTYSGGDKTIYVGFTPRFVIIGDPSNTVVLLPGLTVSHGGSKYAEIRTGGFYVYGSTPLSYNTHPYIAYL